MKVLLVADLHYNLKQFDWLLSEAEHYDLVVLAGDLLELSALASPEAQIVVVRTYLERISRASQVVICSGNHDLDAEDAGERYADWVLKLDNPRICRDGQHRLIGDTLISALPWWDGPRTKAQIEEQLGRDAEVRPDGGTWVWAHHAPPSESGLSWGGSRSYGDPDLVHWIKKFGPDLVFSGHVHEAPFLAGGKWVDRISTACCFNMGQQIGPIPTHIALNLSCKEAVWLSQAGPQHTTLDSKGIPSSITALPDWF